MRVILNSFFGFLLVLAASARAAAPAHLVLVIEENHSYSQIIGSAECPYINALAAHGALLTRSFAVGHPSEPNYLALLSGSTWGVTDDTCPPPGSPYPGDNLGSLLRAAGLSFDGYSEGLPKPGSQDCSDGVQSGYRRKHNSWVDFSTLPGDTNRPFSDFPTDYGALPTLCVVVPDMEHDMHDGSPAEADQWLRGNLDGYVRWCTGHASVLWITWDEDNGAEGNRIPTLVYGAGVRAGRIRTRTDHYGVLSTLCSLYGLKAPGLAARAKPIAGIFK